MLMIFMLAKRKLKYLKIIVKKVAVAKQGKLLWTLKSPIFLFYSLTQNTTTFEKKSIVKTKTELPELEDSDDEKNENEKSSYQDDSDKDDKSSYQEDSDNEDKNDSEYQDDSDNQGSDQFQKSDDSG